MKAIFTYPNNSGTSFIDPNYVGDDTVGFQKRIKELVDGTYKPWDGTIPSDTVTNIMSELSKFNEASQLETQGNNSIFDFWYQPLYTANMELITSDITSATATHGVTANIEFTGNHGFYNSQLMTLSAFDGTWNELNGNNYYVKKIDADTIQLCTDVDLTLPLEFYDQENSTISSASVGGTVLFTDADGVHDLTNGTYVQLSNFNNAFEYYNGENLYTQNVTATDFNLSWDSAGNQLFTMSNSNLDLDIEHIILKNNNEIFIKLTAGQTQFPNGTQVSFDPNDGTTYGDNGPNSGLSTELSLYTSLNPGLPLYLERTGNADEYKLYVLSWPNNTKEYDIWQYILSNASNGYFNAAKHTTVNLNRAANDYFYSYVYTDTQGADLTGNAAYMTSPMGSNTTVKTNNETTGGGLVNHPYYIGSRNVDEYFLYEDSALTQRKQLDYDILNAKRIKYTTSDPLVHIPKKYDSAGVEITSSSFILNTETIGNLSGLTNTLGNWSWNRANNIDNIPTDPTGGTTYVDFNIRTATYGPNTETILDFVDGYTPGAASDVVTQNVDTSGYTLYSSEELSPGNAILYEIRENGIAITSTALINQITSMITADPQSVYGVPFLAECGYQNQGSGVFTSNGQFWMLITEDITSPSQTYQMKFFEKKSRRDSWRERCSIWASATRT